MSKSDPFIDGTIFFHGISFCLILDVCDVVSTKIKKGVTDSFPTIEYNLSFSF